MTKNGKAWEFGPMMARPGRNVKDRIQMLCGQVLCLVVLLLAFGWLSHPVATHHMVNMYQVTVTNSHGQVVSRTLTPMTVQKR